MFGKLFKSKKIKEIEAKAELFEAKARYQQSKKKYSGKKPSKYEKIGQELSDLEDFKEIVGSGDITKYIKLLENPIVQGLILKFLASKGVSKGSMDDIRTNVLDKK